MNSIQKKLALQYANNAARYAPPAMHTRVWLKAYKKALATLKRREADRRVLLANLFSHF